MIRVMVCKGFAGALQVDLLKSGTCPCMCLFRSGQGLYELLDNPADHSRKPGGSCHDSRA